MYFRRKIDDFLLNWKDDVAHKPLIIKGARQIGKTESILHFANRAYTNVIYINFVLDKRFRAIVSDGYDVDTVIKNISLADPNLNFIPGETIIIFDEIQECSDALNSLKYFNENDNYKKTLKNNLNYINNLKITEKIKTENIQKLYGNKLKTSVSKLETFKSCPYEYFMQYSLKIKEKER